MFKVTAGIAHGLIQPQAVKIIADVIMGGDFLLLILL